MLNLAPFATAFGKLWNRITTEPPYAFLSSAIVNPVTGATIATVDKTTGLFNVPGGTLPVTQTITGDGAITIKQGTVFLTKASAAAITIAAPTATVDDGKKLTIISLTAQAHTVTNTSPGFNNGSTASDVATYGTAIANNFEIVAQQGVWYVYGTAKGVTLG